MPSTSRLNPIQAATIERILAALRLAEIPQADVHVEQRVLRELPKALGYQTSVDFLWSFRAANGLRNRRILTPRKMKELIRRTQAGQSRHEIAEALGCSPQTVSNIRVKLGASAWKFD